MSARDDLFAAACQDMPVGGDEIAEAIQAADLEVAQLIVAHGDRFRAMQGERWYDGILAAAKIVASLPKIEAP